MHCMEEALMEDVNKALLSVLFSFPVAAKPLACGVFWNSFFQFLRNPSSQFRTPSGSALSCGVFHQSILLITGALSLKGTTHIIHTFPGSFRLEFLACSSSFQRTFAFLLRISTRKKHLEFCCPHKLRTTRIPLVLLSICKLGKIHRKSARLVFEGQQFSCSGLVAPFSLLTQLLFFDSLC